MMFSTVGIDNTVVLEVQALNQGTKLVQPSGQPLHGCIFTIMGAEVSKMGCCEARTKDDVGMQRGEHVLVSPNPREGDRLYRGACDHLADGRRQAVQAGTEATHEVAATLQEQSGVENGEFGTSNVGASNLSVSASPRRAPNHMMGFGYPHVREQDGRVSQLTPKTVKAQVKAQLTELDELNADIDRRKSEYEQKRLALSSQTRHKLQAVLSESPAQAAGRAP